MIHEFYAEHEIHQHERELTNDVERRRVNADRVAAHFGGDRLALVAWLARRASHSTAHPVGS